MSNRIRRLFKIKSFLDCLSERRGRELLNETFKKADKYSNVM